MEIYRLVVLHLSIYIHTKIISPIPFEFFFFLEPYTPSHCTNMPGNLLAIEVPVSLGLFTPTRSKALTDTQYASLLLRNL